MRYWGGVWQKLMVTQVRGELQSQKVGISCFASRLNSRREREIETKKKKKKKRVGLIKFQSW